jgi:hypothetical protein
LLKIRIEVDGTGKSPDYFLDYVELRDLDTDERIDAMCGKWLKWESTDKGAQSFRELVVYRPDVEPLPREFWQNYILRKFMKNGTFSVFTVTFKSL